MFSEIQQLQGKTISTAHVYSDSVKITFDDGKTVAAIFVQAEDGKLRVQIGTRGPEGAGPAVQVYPGMVSDPGPLPDYARRAGD